MSIGPTLMPPAKLLGIARPADLQALGCAVAIGFGFDAFVHVGAATLGGALLGGAVIGALVLTHRFTRWQARGTLGLAALLLPFLVLRTSPWLLPMDVAGACGLLAIAGVAQRLDIFDLSPGQAIWQAFIAAGHQFTAVGFIVRAVKWSPLANKRRLAAALRGTLLAVPVVLILAALLVSADSVFASVVNVHVKIASASGHLVLIALGAMLGSGVVRIASSTPTDPVAGHLAMGTTETTIVLGSVTALFAVFVTTQIIALSGGADHVLHTAGLTYAQYARAGFFQLLGVAAITLGLVTSLRTTIHSQSGASRTRFYRLALVLTALSFAIVISAVRKLDLYEKAFGWTMLRLAATAFAVWIGSVLLLLAASLAGVVRRRSWLVGATALSAWVAVFAFNVINPDAIVTRSAIARTDGTEITQLAKLGAVSSDGEAVLYQNADRLPSAALAALRRQTNCSVESNGNKTFDYNRSEDHLAKARRQFCSGHS